MKQKLLKFSLVGFILMLIGVVYAQTNEGTPEPTTIFSWEGNADGAIVSGGTVTATDANGTDVTGEDVNTSTGAFKCIRLRGAKDFSTFKVIITLDNELKAGDKIAITACRNKDVANKKSGLLAKFDKGGQLSTSQNGLEFVNIDTSDASAADQNRGTEPNTLIFDIPSDAAGSKVITMTRAETGTNLFITKIIITSTNSDDNGNNDPEEPVTNPVELTWDYTEKAPTSSPDNGLYYASAINDAAGTNLGLKGVKLNSSGYAFFEKPEVKGTLTLTISDRKDATKPYAVNVYNCTITDGVATKGELIGEVAVDASPGKGSIDLAASVTGVYIERKTGSEGVISKITFKQYVPRTFVDFEMSLFNLPTEFDPTTLPAGVTLSGTYNNDAHGYRNATVTVPVDGTVKFTIGGCQYTSQAFTVTNSANETLATITPKTEKCYNQDGSAVTYLYTGGPTTLSFNNIQYLSYFKAEATEVAEATVTITDQNGNKLGEKVVYEGDAIGEIPYSEADLTIAEGMKFRGWTYMNNVKVKATDVVTGNVTVKASVTPIESVSVGSIQNYDLTSATFYPEDHETIEISGAAYYNNHGWDFSANGSFTIDVAGKAQIVLSLCQYGNGTTIKVTDANSNTIAEDVPAKAESDGGNTIVKYDGEATRLTFTFASQTYLHKITVYNVKDFMEKDAVSGYYIVPAGDAASLIMAINAASAEEGAKIFLPNGTYDLGETTKTLVSGKNISLIGQSAEETIIVNRPPKTAEGLDNADLLKNTSEGLYIQDISLKNDFAYGGNDGRAASLHDTGTKTICKNVFLLSHQDTYYSHKVGGLYYFEGGELHGTVDYLCGNGKAYFNECKIVNEKRSSATITANSELYVFNNCTVENNADSYNLGRAWSDNPVCIYLNTTLLDPSKLIDTRWNLSGINCDYSVAGEYGTKNAAGEDITPESNVVTFKKANTEMNTILDATALETYSIKNVLGEWAQTALAEATQVAAPNNAELSANKIEWTAVNGATAYAVFKNGILVGITTETSFEVTDVKTNDVLTIRSANIRGGFGAEGVVTEKTTGIDNAKVNTEKPAIYNMHGMRIEKTQKGLNIIDGKKIMK